MARILLGATGSVAAVRVPILVKLLKDSDHDVQVVTTEHATYFFDPQSVSCRVYRDADEWPGDRYQRGQEILHIELRRWADLLLVAPLDANTLAKLAVGLCDNCLTCVWRAWDRSKPIVLAPAMNTLMWLNHYTLKHLRTLAVDHGAISTEEIDNIESLIRAINHHCKALRVVPPVAKELACGDFGIGGMAELSDILQVVQDLLTHAPITR